jgi:tetratricopeptide (TPR) repeat protein
MRLGTAVLLSTLFIPSGAFAAISVIGGSIAHGCYQAAMRGGTLANEQICTLALDDISLSLRNRAATYVNRGVVRTGLRRFEAALSDYDQAIAMGQRLSPVDLAITHVDRASVLNAVGRYNEAIEDANKGLSLGTPKPEIAYYNRALAEDYLGNFRAAYYDYKQALALAPGFMPAAEQLRRFRVETRPASGT